MSTANRFFSSQELSAWRAIPTAVISDERMHRGVLASIRPLFPGRRFAGQAFTIEVESEQSTSPRQALAQVWREACIVIDARRTPDVAVWGGNLTRVAMRQGVSAVIVDGNVRDVAELRDSRIAVCSRGVTPRGPKWGGRVGDTIQCGGVTIRRGDLVIGDEDGVIAIPFEETHGDLLVRCRARVDRESEEERA